MSKWICLKISQYWNFIHTYLWYPVTTEQAVANLPPGCILPCPTAWVQIRLNTASFYSKIKTTEDVYIYACQSSCLFTWKPHVLLRKSQINRDIMQPYFFHVHTMASSMSTPWLLPCPHHGFILMQCTGLHGLPRSTVVSQGCVIRCSFFS